MDSRIRKARSMLMSYRDAMVETGPFIDEDFISVVDLIAALDSILIITGLGKSGLVGQKVAATFSSTGTPAVFVHPVEALHGDLGIVGPGSALLAISKSGGNEETIEFARQFKVIVAGPIITLTEPGSRLQSYADIALHIPRMAEIDEWNLAPTTSTMTSMAICDVLSICVQEKRGLTADDFAQFHPSGALGRRLRLLAKDVMISGDALPIQSADISFTDAVYEISRKGLGMVLLTKSNGELRGVLTDGDVRRLMSRKVNYQEMTAGECVDASRRGDDLPFVDRAWAAADTKAIDCVTLMEEKRITSLVIVENDKPIGVVQMRDLLAAGL